MSSTGAAVVTATLLGGDFTLAVLAAGYFSALVGGTTVFSGTEKTANILFPDASAIIAYGCKKSREIPAHGTAATRAPITSLAIILKGKGGTI